MSRVRRLLGSVSDVEMVPPMLLICKPLFLSISTFETPPKNDTDARHRHWPVCQPLCLWTGGVKMVISTFETLPSGVCGWRAYSDNAGRLQVVEFRLHAIQPLLAVDHQQPLAAQVAEHDVSEAVL